MVRAPSVIFAEQVASEDDAGADTMAGGAILNVNVGVLGHVDSGKTSLARAMSTVASTNAFDKSNQSKERGITLDLGFSSFCAELPPQLAKDGRFFVSHLTPVSPPPPLL